MKSIEIAASTSTEEDEIGAANSLSLGSKPF